MLLFSFHAFHLNRVLLLKERICSSRSKFFPERVNTFWKSLLEELSPLGKHIEIQVVPFCKTMENRPISF